jgi:serine/threonine-protein kinase
LIDAHNDDHLWAESYDGGLEDVLSLQSEVALTAAKAIKATVSPQEQRSLSATPEISPEAYQLYLKGLHAWNRCNRKALQRAEQLFRSALEVDPGCALVHSALADTYSVMMFYNYLGGRDALPLVRHEAQEAIRLDESLAQAHASLAWAHLWEWKFAESEAGFLRALELNPNYGNARHWYANLLCFQGRGEESIEQMQAAMQVDPLSAQIANSMGWTYYVLRRYGESIRQLEQVLELDPSFANAHLLLSLNYLERGDRKLADHHVRRAIELDPGQPEYELFKAYVEARLGRSERARESLRHAQADVDIIARSAIVHVALGEHELALDDLERALDEQPWTVLNLKLYPWYDPLRDEPRFQALVDRLGLG